jgi:hypothetical protein
MIIVKRILRKCFRLYILWDKKHPKGPSFTEMILLGFIIGLIGFRYIYKANTDRTPASILYWDYVEPKYPKEWHPLEK